MRGSRNFRKVCVCVGGGGRVGVWGGGGGGSQQRIPQRAVRTSLEKQLDRSNCHSGKSATIRESKYVRSIMRSTLSPSRKKAPFCSPEMAQ